MEDAAQKEAFAAIKKLWWIELVLGILWIIVSLIILQYNSSSITMVGVIIGILFLVAGIQNFFIAYVSESWKWLWILFGVVFVIAGVVALAYPKNTFESIADVVGFLFLIVGIFWIVEALATRETYQLWWLGLIAGIMMVILAFWAAGQFFITKQYTLLVFAGIWALIHGITDIIKAFEIKKYGEAPL